MYFERFILTLKSTPPEPGQPIGPGPYALMMWGDNASGQLGQGNTLSRSSPTQVAGSWAVTSTGGGTSGGIKSDGTLWMWGSGTQGQMGDGTLVSKSAPVAVGAATWTDMAVNSSVTAVKSDGTLWAWGLNTYGQLGLGDTVRRSSPVQVGADTNWKSVFCGAYSSYAIKTNGTLWAWGRNNQGQLGIGSTTSTSSPVQVGAATTWKRLHCGQWTSTDASVIALRDDNTLWVWGGNSSGQLGLGDTTNRSTPIQLGSDLWGSVAPSGQHCTIAVKMDGTMWGWGTNPFDILNTGDGLNRSSPIQINGQDTWIQVSSLGYSSTFHGLQSNGTLWGTGANTAGQLGDGTTTNKSSWVQIGAGYKDLPNNSSSSTSSAHK